VNFSLKNKFKIVAMRLEQLLSIYSSYQFFDHESIGVMFSVYDGFEVDSSYSE